MKVVSTEDRLVKLGNVRKSGKSGDSWLDELYLLGKHLERLQIFVKASYM